MVHKEKLNFTGIHCVQNGCTESIGKSIGSIAAICNTIHELSKIYFDTRAERPAAKGEAILAVAVANQIGVPVDPSGVAASGFG